MADGKSVRVIALPSGRELWTAKVSDEGLAAIALSPDGNVVATAGGIAESTVRLWDIRSKTEIRQLEGHRGYVIGLLFWPDGKTLASASADQTIRLWDLSISTNLPPSRVLRGHKLEVWSLSLLGDGTTLASGSKDGSVYLWDTSASRLDHTFASVPASLAAWSFSADGKAITALDRQGRVSTWQGGDFSERKPIFDLARGSINSVRLSPDGRFMAASSMQGAVKVWDLSDGKLLREFSAHSGPVSVAGWLPQSRKLLIARLNDNMVDEWDLTSWQKTASLEPPPNYAAVAISRGEEWILAVGYGGQSMLRNIPSGRQTTLTLDIRQPVEADFSQDGKFFAVASKLGYARLWEREPPREVATFRGFLLGVHSVAFSPDGARLAVGSNWKEAVKLWDTQSLQELLTLEGQGSFFYSSAFSPDGNILASLAGQSGKLHLWRAPSWEEIEKSERTN